MRLFASTVLAIGLLSGSAVAADLLPSTAEVYIDEVAYDWSGLYVGGQLGYTFGVGVVDIPGYAQPTFDVGVNGVGGGVHIGANAQFDQFVLGVELGGNFIGANGRALSGGFAEEYVIDQNWDASLVARAGLAADSFLIYALGGAAVTSITANYDPAGFPDATDTVWGWTVGAGVEHAFTDTITGGLEYRYTDYGTANFMHGGPSSVDLNTHAVTARLSFHF